MAWKLFIPNDFQEVAVSDLRNTLTEIYKTKGELTPQIVVDEARPEDHPLHSRFEWDDAAAGEAYRRVQAQEMIRSVKIVFTEASTGEKKSVRAFSSLHEPGSRTDDSAPATGYAPTEDLVQDEFARQLLLRQCSRDIATLKRKYGHLQEFVELVVAAINPDDTEDGVA